MYKCYPDLYGKKNILGGNMSDDLFKMMDDELLHVFYDVI